MSPSKPSKSRVPHPILGSLKAQDPHGRLDGDQRLRNPGGQTAFSTPSKRRVHVGAGKDTIRL